MAKAHRYNPKPKAPILGDYAKWTTDEVKQRFPARGHEFAPRTRADKVHAKLKDLLPDIPYHLSVSELDGRWGYDIELWIREGGPNPTFKIRVSRHAVNFRQIANQILLLI